jgi:hypothetical protein
MINSNAKFTDEETDALMAVLRSIIPLGREEWEQVVYEYNKSFPLCNRGLENLRRKYNTMANKKIPTGDPTMPDHVKLAKDIKRMIMSKSEAQVLGKRSLETEDDSSDDENPIVSASNIGPAIDINNNKNDSGSSECTSKSKLRTFKRGKSEMNEFMEYMLLSDRLTEKRERRKERRDEMRNQQMMMMMMLMASGGNKKGKKKLKKIVEANINSASSSSDESSEDDDDLKVFGKK